MRLSTINVVAGILSGLKINRIPDKKVKSALVNDYIHLRRFVKDADEQRRELIEKFQSDWRDELGAVEEFRKEGKPVVGHEDYLDAERDANKAIADIFDQEVDASPKSIPLDAFLSAFSKDELTFEQIATLQDAGIIDA